MTNLLVQLNCKLLIVNINNLASSAIVLKAYQGEFLVIRLKGHYSSLGILGYNCLQVLVGVISQLNWWNTCSKNHLTAFK